MKIELTSKNDLAKILEMEKDFENQEFIESYSLARHKEVIQKEGEEHLSIFDENSKLIGFIILAGLTNENKSIEFKRIVISKKGKGYGTKAIELIKQKCFQEYNCNRLWLDVFDFNERAIHVYQNLGFNKDGVLRECVKTNQGFKDLVIMSILKSEYDISTGL